jgi:serine protease
MKRIFSVALFFTIVFAHAQNIYKDRRDGEIYLKFKDNYKLRFDIDNAGYFPVEQLGDLSELAARYKVTQVQQSFYFAKETNLKQTIRLYFDKAKEVDAFINELKQLPFVEYAEHVPYFRIELTPNDMGTNSFNNGTWHLYKINAQQAWDISTGNTNIKVAIVDDAVQTNHPDLAANMLAGRDVALGNNNPNPPTTAYSHGTHVAGISSAVSNNGTGVASIGYSVKIIPIKATNASTSISHGYEGVTWAANNGADIINMSWGGTFGGQTGNNVINNAFNAGKTLVAAAGNDNEETTFFPAGYTNVIAVASSTNTDAKSSFSNFGAYVDISAPGSNIRSTVPTSTYAVYNGTSMASPLVAGLCALVKSVNTNFTPTQIRNCITSTAVNIDAQNSAYIGKLGAGRIDAYAALQCAQGSVVAYDATITAITTPTGSSCSNTFTPQLTLKNNGSNNLTSLTISYQVDNNTPSTFNWTGNLTPQATVNVTLPSVTTTAGSHTFTATTSNTVNGSQTDANASNNSRSSTFNVFGSPGQMLPFTENFESNSFTTNNWSVENPDNGLGWEFVTTAGNTPGTRSARIPFYSYQATGQRDGLVTPPLNFQGYDSIKLTFDHAYRRYNTSSSDSLIIYVSTNCGNTYQRIFTRGENGTGVFATAATSTADFFPSVNTDWCFAGTVGSACYTINLNAFIGNPSVRIKFEGYNNYGNNLYLDDINIIGVSSGQPPAAAFTPVGGNTVCAGSSVSFNNQSTNQPTAYTWEFPGATPATSSDPNPSVVFNQSGQFTVKLRVSNASGSDSTTQTINVNPSPVVNATAFPNPACVGEDVLLSASGATNYVWNSGLSSFSGDSSTISAVDTVTYIVTGSNLNGCSAIDTLTVFVSPPPVASAAVTGSTCEGQSISLTSSGGASYTWSGPNNYTSSSQNPQINNASSLNSGSYTVTVSTGNCSDVASVNVTVNALIQVQLSTQSGSTIFCSADGVVTLVGSPAGGVFSGTAVSGNSFNPASAGAGQFSLTYTYTSSNGCVGSSVLNLNVVNTPVANISASPSVCEGAVVNFVGSGGGNYNWSGPDGFTSQIQNPQIAQSTLANGGTYTLTVTVGNCTNVKTHTLTVNENPVVTMEFPNGQLVYCIDEGGAYISTTPTGGTLTGPGLTGNIFTPQSAGIGQHVYSYSYTDFNGCSNSTQKTIEVRECVGVNELYANSFMRLYPNPVNDMVFIEGTSDKQMVRITDLTGRIVMEQQSSPEITTLDLSAFQAATYFATVIESGKLIFATKVVKF